MARNVVFYKFHTEATAPADGAEFGVNLYDSCTINVTGTATSFKIIPELRFDLQNESEEWVQFSIVNVDGFEVLDEITEVGAYIAPVSNAAKIRFRIEEISGGDVTVCGRLAM